MIRVVHGPLEDAATAAVLWPVTAEWDAVTAAMRRFELAAGPEPAEQAHRLGELPVGSAVITGAGNLRAQFLVHAIVRSMDEPVSGHGVRRALQNGLRRIAEWAIESVAMPPLGTGAGNLDAEESAQTMITTLLEHMREAAHPSDVEIRVDSDYERDAFERALAMHGNASSAADTQ
ncbi:MAG TPA: macro domain-containing protein [Longimicrobiales bacterium]|nr:macro domain-containing protein [Longimicrobiales bacterium]